jgi:nitroreductase
MHDHIKSAPLAPDSAALDRILRKRFSCRAFLAQPVRREIVMRILEMAQHTPSWNNVQPWNVIITEGEATERFRRALLGQAQDGQKPIRDFPFPREYREPYLSRRRQCGFALYDAVGVKRGDKAAYARQTLENFRLFGAPHVALISTDEALGVYGAVDCGAYVMSFMLAARALGVATIAQAALASFSDLVRAHFKLPEEQLFICGISFGYADMAHPANLYRTTRVNTETVATFVAD